MATAQQALAKLTSGQTLTAEEKALLNIKPTTTTSAAPTTSATARLDAAAAANAANAASTIAALKDLGVGGTTTTPAKQLNEMTPEELKAFQASRLADVTKTRETGGGTTPPYDAPTGTHWSFMNGKWTLYKDPTPVTSPVGGGGGGGKGAGATGGGAVDNTVTTSTLDVNPTLAITKAYMVNMGYPADLIDSSTEFLKNLIIDGMTPSNAVDILTTAKNYTTKSGKVIDSPFYAAYGTYNEGLAKPKTASELFNAVEGYKATAAKYNLSDKFKTPEFMKNLVKNNWTVADFDQAANTARLFAVTSDPKKVEAMRKLGYINNSQDLTDFYLDPTIGKEKMQQNIATVAYGTEVLRRITPENLMTFNQDFINKVGASFAQQGLSEAEATAAAVKGAQNLSETLAPTYALTGIYDRGANLKVSDVQTALEQEQLTGMPSELRKKVTQQNIAAFNAAPGISRYGISQKGPAGQF
jgi:hypothetical protein